MSYPARAEGLVSRLQTFGSIARSILTEYPSSIVSGEIWESLLISAKDSSHDAMTISKA